MFDLSTSNDQAFHHKCLWSSNLREFVRTAVILTPAREASRVGTAFCGQDPLDPQDLVECSFFLKFETPFEVERSLLLLHEMQAGLNPISLIKY